MTKLFQKFAVDAFGATPLSTSTKFKKLSTTTVGAALLTLGAINTAPAQAIQVTYNFEGPAISLIEGSANTEDFVRGSITFDTTPATPPIDVLEPGEQGERFLYTNAIVDFTFSTDAISRSLQGGDILLQNDYERCISRIDTQCEQFQTENDTLFFGSENSQGNARLIISGTNQELLTSGLLPATYPPTDEIFRIDFFWDTKDDSEIIASNDIQLVKEPTTPVPEPSSLVSLVGLGLTSLFIKRKQFYAATNKSSHL